jgi:hypothetical protein
VRQPRRTRRPQPLPRILPVVLQSFVSSSSTPSMSSAEAVAAHSAAESRMSHAGEAMIAPHTGRGAIGEPLQLRVGTYLGRGWMPLPLESHI